MTLSIFFNLLLKNIFDYTKFIMGYTLISIMLGWFLDCTIFNLAIYN